jgi:long-chain acyl-CoA synthetase
MTAAKVLEQEFGTVPDLIRAHAAERPCHPALIQDDRALSFAALDARMDEVAAALQRDTARSHQAGQHDQDSQSHSSLSLRERHDGH